MKSRSHRIIERLRRARGISSYVVGLTGLLALTSLQIGCGGASQQTKAETSQKPGGQETRQRYGNLSQRDLSVESFDLNKDGDSDQWKFFARDEERLVRVERDMNFDGKVDVWQHADAAGEISEEEMDLDLDGTVDLVSHYENGTLDRKELSVRFDNSFSIVKFYGKSGQLLRIERDKDGDTQTDVWEYYNEKGQRERVGWDDNDDGVPDSFDQLP